MTLCVLAPSQYHHPPRLRAESVCRLFGSFQRSRRFVGKRIENNTHARNETFGSGGAPHCAARRDNCPTKSNPLCAKHLSNRDRGFSGIGFDYVNLLISRPQTSHETFCRRQQARRTTHSYLRCARWVRGRYCVLRVTDRYARNLNAQASRSRSSEAINWNGLPFLNPLAPAIASRLRCNQQRWSGIDDGARSRAQCAARRRAPRVSVIATRSLPISGTMEGAQANGASTSSSGAVASTRLRPLALAR
jgi:hypothetical protein